MIAYRWICLSFGHGGTNEYICQGWMIQSVSSYFLYTMFALLRPRSHHTHWKTERKKKFNMQRHQFTSVAMRASVSFYARWQYVLIFYGNSNSNSDYIHIIRNLLSITAPSSWVSWKVQRGQDLHCWNADVGCEWSHWKFWYWNLKGVAGNADTRSKCFIIQCCNNNWTLAAQRR